MSCHASLRLLSAERDRPLSTSEQSQLDRHLRECASCRSAREHLAAAAEQWRASTAQTVTPAVGPFLSELEERLRRPQTRSPRRSAPAWRGWLGAGVSLAAAAALAVIVSTDRPAGAAALPRADFVEAGDSRASTLVYVDEDSGWLIVWATAPGAAPG